MLLEGPTWSTLYLATVKLKKKQNEYMYIIYFINIILWSTLFLATVKLKKYICILYIYKYYKYYIFIRPVSYIHANVRFN